MEIHQVEINNDRLDSCAPDKGEAPRGVGNALVNGLYFQVGNVDGITARGKDNSKRRNKFSTSARSWPG